MDERRRDPRAAIRFAARCVVGNNREYMDCEIVNVGAEGLAVLVQMQDMKRIPYLKFRFMDLKPQLCLDLKSRLALFQLLLETRLSTRLTQTHKHLGA